MTPKNERLFPKRYAHNYYSSYRIRTLVEELISKYVDTNFGKKRLLDYGCGDVPYLPLFDGKVSKYVTCDIALNPRAEVTIAPDGTVPLPSATFDIVFSIQVLEHVDDVDTYLAEANRLLDKDGLLLLSTHGQWRWHPFPKDLWRWTHEGLIYTIEKSGFKVIDKMWAVGMLAYSSQLRLFYLKQIMQGKSALTKLLFKIISLIYNVQMALFDKLEQRNRENDNAAIYFIVARKNSSYTVTPD